VGVLVGVIVELAVAFGRDVLVGKSVVDGVSVALGIAVVFTESELNVLMGDSTLAELHPAMMMDRKSPNAIPVITRIAYLLVPEMSFILDGDYLGSLL
jgi:hypothetical protein